MLPDALHRDRTKINAGWDGPITEEFHHAFGRARGAHVDVGCCFAKPRITNASADQPRPFTRFCDGLQQAEQVVGQGR